MAEFTRRLVADRVAPVGENGMAGGNANGATNGTSHGPKETPATKNGRRTRATASRTKVSFTLDSKTYAILDTIARHRDIGLSAALRQAIAILGIIDENLNDSGKLYLEKQSGERERLIIPW
jgi:hypothetical protein